VPIYLSMLQYTGVRSCLRNMQSYSLANCDAPLHLSNLKSNGLTWVICKHAVEMASSSSIRWGCSGIDQTSPGFCQHRLWTLLKARLSEICTKSVGVAANRERRYVRRWGKPLR
jgi:hypothetical protein